MVSLQTSTTWAPARKVTENLEIKLTDIHNGYTEISRIELSNIHDDIKKIKKWQVVYHR